MRKIAIYGKGGIGKSTTSANLSVSLANKGLRILQIGCDPKHDSTRTITGNFIPTVLELWRESEKTQTAITKKMVLHHGYKGVACIEAGGPEPGVGCAGRGIIRMLDILEDLDIFQGGYDLIIFDVLGDVVCGGFAKPIQTGYSQEIYIITSGEFMSLYAANNISYAINKVGQSRGVRLGGIICNSRAIEREEALVCEFAERIGSRLLHFVPRDLLIQKFERYAKTVVEAAPESNPAQGYATLADKIYHNQDFRIPSPLSFDELITLCENYDEVESVHK